MSLENGNTEIKSKRKMLIKRMNAALKTYSENTPQHSKTVENTTTADESYKNVDQDQDFQVDSINIDEHVEIIINAPGTALYKDIKYAVFKDILDVRDTLISYIVDGTPENAADRQTYLTVYSDTNVLIHQLANDTMSIIDVRRNLQRLQSQLKRFRAKHGLHTTATERDMAKASQRILNIIKTHQDDIDPNIIITAKRLKGYVLPQNMVSDLNDIIDKLLTEPAEPLDYDADPLDRVEKQELYKELEDNRLKLISYQNLLDDLSDELIRIKDEQKTPVAYSAEDKPKDPVIKSIVDEYKNSKGVLEEMVGRTFKLAPKHTRTPQYYRETGMMATLFGSIAMVFGGVAMSGTIMLLGAALFALAIAATDRASSLSAIEAGKAKRKTVEGQDKAQDAIDAPAEALPDTTQTIDKFLDAIHHSQIDKLKDIYLSEDNAPYYGYMLLDRNAFIEYYQIDIPDENLVGMTHESKVEDPSMIEAISRYKEARPATDDMVLGAIKDIKSSHMYEKELKTDALTKTLIDKAPNLERSPYHASMQQFAEQVKNNNKDQNQSQKNNESSARQNDVW